MSQADLTKLAKLRAEMIKQRRDIRAGTETNVRRASHTRKQIARILTKLNAPTKEEPV